MVMVRVRVRVRVRVTVTVRKSVVILATGVRFGIVYTVVPNRKRRSVTITRCSANQEVECCLSHAWQSFKRSKGVKLNAILECNFSPENEQRTQPL
jgi:hypothetical protein